MTEDEIRKIFFPSLERKRREAILKGYHFAYYTTADTATQILSTMKIWLRSTGVMNDHSEVEHGAGIVFEVLKSDAGKRYLDAVESVWSGAADELRRRINDFLPIILGDTFITCLSEHMPKIDDIHGKLSMWRAYGGENGVAIVLNRAPILSEKTDVGAYAHPVSYAGRIAVHSDLLEVAHKLVLEKTELRQLPEQQFIELLFQGLRAHAVATKHEAFSEEREWRVVASPMLMPVSSPFIKQEVKCIGSVSQIVQILDLRAAANSGMHELEPKHLINRILIGPTLYPTVIFRSMVKLLGDLGVEDPHTRVHITRVPLRNNQR